MFTPMGAFVINRLQTDQWVKAFCLFTFNIRGNAQFQFNLFEFVPCMCKNISRRVGVT